MPGVTVLWRIGSSCNDLPLGTFRTDEWRISTQPVASNLADTIVMQTAKAVNSEITLYWLRVERVNCQLIGRWQYTNS